MTVGTAYGRLLCARLVLLGGLLLLVRRLLQGHGTAPDRPGELEEDLSVIAGLAVLATYGGVGHAAAGSQTTLALLSDSAHLAAVATWVGGLVLLAACLLPSRRAAEIAVALPRFSQLAQAAVVVLIVTGTYQGWREVGSLPALAFTHYGQLLIAKIAAFVVLVGLGNLGRIAVRRRYLIPVAHALSTQDTVERSPSEEDRLLRRLRISVGLEVSIAAGVLALAAALVSTPPARSTYAEAYRASLLPVSDGSAQLAPAPARHGVNTVRPDAVGPTAFADPDPASHAHVRAPIALLVGPPR